MRVFQKRLDLIVQPRAGEFCSIILSNSFEGFFVELNMSSKKWLLGCSYDPNQDNIASNLRNVSAALEKPCTDYENIILLGNFNVKSLVKQKTYFSILQPQF